MWLKFGISFVISSMFFGIGFLALNGLHNSKKSYECRILCGNKNASKVDENNKCWCSNLDWYKLPEGEL